MKVHVLYSVRRALFSAVFPLTASLLSCAARAAELPAGYEAVAGISSTSGGKQYILTDYVPSSCNITIEANVVLTKWATQGIWCSRVGSTSETMTLFCWAVGNYFRTDRASNTGVYANRSATLNEPTVLRADYAARTFSVNGTASDNLMGAGDFTPKANLAFFASHSNGSGWGNFAEMALLGVKIYAADGTLECEFVPVRCSEKAGTKDEFGLYELVSGKYYPSAAAAGFVNYEIASAAFTEETGASGEELLVMTVEKGVYVLNDADRARIESSGRTLVLRGAGQVAPGALANFTGDIVLEGGVWQVTAVNSLGAHNTGSVYVRPGATLQMATTAARSVVGKKIYLEGTGFGDIGAFYSCSASWNSLSGCEFRLTGDAYIDQTQRIDYYTFFDTCGYNLRFSGPNSTGVGGNYFTNSAARASTVTVDGNRMIVAQNNGKHYFGTAADHLCLTNGANYPMDWRVSHDWTLDFQHGAKLPVTTQMYPNTETVKGCLAGPGPVVLSGTVKAGDGVLKSTGVTNFVTTIAAPLRGSGRLEVDPGWLNLMSADNTYSGIVSVKGRSDAARAGVRVWAGAGYAAEKTLVENADFEYQASTGLNLDYMAFSGARSTLKGGSDPSAAGGVRIGTLAKTGDGALTVAGNPSIAAAAIDAGTLALARRYYGNAGLMEGKYIDTVNASGQQIWCSQNDGIEAKIGEENWTYSPGGATKVFSGYTSEVVGGVRRATAIAYRGYLWNRNATNETWTFALHMNFRMIMRLNGAWTPWTNIGEKGTNLWTTTVKPGANPLLVYSLSANWNASQVPSPRFDGLGLSYCRGPVDASQPDPASFARLDDGGTGYLLTVDDTDGLLASAAMLPQFGQLTFGPQTTFDLKGNTLALADLRGQPTVANAGGLGLTRWTLTDESLAAGRTLTVDGPLAFTDGAVLDLDISPVTCSEETTQLLAAGMTVAAAESIVGEPVLSPALVRVGATLAKAADGKSLVLQMPAQKSVAIRDGVFTATVRNLSGETRIRIYRDGRIVEEILLGVGHEQRVCEWYSSVPGLYFAEVEQIDEGAEAGAYIVLKTVSNPALLTAVGAAVTFVAPDGDDGNDGRSREQAKASVQAAVEALGETGGTVYVLPGTYSSPLAYNTVNVSNAVSIVGWTIDPSQVVLSGVSGTNARIVRLAHAEAALRMVTLRGGYTWSGSGTAWPEMEGATVVAGGGNVYIAPAGGTVENCILAGGYSGSWDYAGGNAYLRGGRLVNCVLDGGGANSLTSDKWRFCGASLCARAGTVENCWIRNVEPISGKSSNAYAIGLYGTALMVNCTVTGNTSYFGTIVVGGSGVRIFDSAIYDNAATAEGRGELADLYVRTEHDGQTSVDPAAAFVACAATRAINDSCRAIDAPGFTDAAGGDYTLSAGSPLIDAGSPAAVSGRTGEFDLLGAPRVSQGRVDIGCFEFRLPKLKPVGALIIVR